MAGAMGSSLRLSSRLLLRHRRLDRSDGTMCRDRRLRLTVGLSASCGCGCQWSSRNRHHLPLWRWRLQTRLEKLRRRRTRGGEEWARGCGSCTCIYLRWSISRRPKLRLRTRSRGGGGGDGGCDWGCSFKSRSPLLLCLSFLRCDNRSSRLHLWVRSSAMHGGGWMWSSAERDEPGC